MKVLVFEPVQVFRRAGETREAAAAKLPLDIRIDGQVGKERLEGRGVQRGKLF